MDEKNGYARSTRIWSFLQMVFSIGLLYFLDGLPLENLDAKRIQDLKTFCSEKLDYYLDIKSTLLTFKILQSCFTTLIVVRNLLTIFYISTKVKSSKTATEIMSIKEKWIDSCCSKLFKNVQDLIQIVLIVYAIYNIFWGSSSSSSCSHVDFTKTEENFGNNKIIVLLGNVFAYYFKVFLWMTNSFFFLSASFACEQEKKNALDIEVPKPEPRQKRKDKRNKQKKDKQTTLDFTQSEDDSMRKPLLYAPPASNDDSEPVKQYAKQTYKPYESEKSSQLFQPYNQTYQPYQSEKTNQGNQLYKPYQPN